MIACLDLRRSISLTLNIAPDVMKYTHVLSQTDSCGFFVLSLPHCQKRHLRSVPFLKQFRLFTENSGKELNVKESSLKSSEEVFR
jgi:hypothetical protein